MLHHIIVNAQKFQEYLNVQYTLILFWTNIENIYYSNGKNVANLSYLYFFENNKLSDYLADHLLIVTNAEIMLNLAVKNEKKFVPIQNMDIMICL